MADKEIVESLNKVSGNLEVINKTLTDAQKTENTQSPTDAAVWKKRVENLIGIVDCRCKRKFFTTQKKLFIVTVIVVSFVVAFLVILLNSTVTGLVVSYSHLLHSDENQTLSPDGQLGFLVGQLPSVSSLTISVVAVIASLWAIMLSVLRTSSYKELANEYYRNLLKDVDTKERPYLKALINMKCREFDLKLRDIYDSDHDLFKEKSLLESL
jgi:hypothetical protein